MRTLSRLVFALAVCVAPLARAGAGGSAHVTVSIKADVDVKAQSYASVGDAAYAAGKLDAALAAYGEGFAKTRDAAFVYAMARCHEQLGHKDEAKAMFKMYLGAGASLKYKAEAEGAISAKGAVGALGKVKDTAVHVVGEIGAGVYSAAKVSIATTIDAGAKVEAKAGDEAYAAGKWEEASRHYGEAYVKSQASIALYAGAQAHAQAGHAFEARGMLAGYLVAAPKSKEAADAKTLLLALGSRADLATKVSVHAKLDASIKAQAELADKAMASGKFLDASKAYADAYAKHADAALLYAKGMAQFYAGAAADAQASLKAYLAAGGDLQFKVSAQAALQASGGTY